MEKEKFFYKTWWFWSLWTIIISLIIIGAFVVHLYHLEFYKEMFNNPISVIVENSTSKTEETYSATVSGMAVADNSQEENKANGEYILVDNEYCTMTFKSSGVDSYGDVVINVLIENKSNIPLLIGIDNDTATINGYMLSPFWATTVDAGKKENASITIYEGMLEKNNISNTGKLNIEWIFNASNSETWKNVFETNKVNISVN